MFQFLLPFLPLLKAVGTLATAGAGIYATHAALQRQDDLPTPPNLSGKDAVNAEYAELLRRSRARTRTVFAGDQETPQFTQPTLLGPGGGSY